MSMPLSRREVLQAAAVALGGTSVFAARFDLLIKGGRVIDPASDSTRGSMWAIAKGRIAALQPNIAGDRRRRA